MRRGSLVAAGALSLAGGLVMMAAVVRGDETPRAPEEPKKAVRQRHIEIVRGGPRLGVSIEDVTAADMARLKLAEERGAVVKEVVPGSAAEKAGLKEGDVILGFQGQKVWSAAELRRMVRETPPGRPVALEVSRGGAVQRLTARTEEEKERAWAFGDDDFHFEMPALPEMPPVPPLPPVLADHGERTRDLVFRMLDRGPRRLGITYQGLSSQLASYFKVGGGVLVTEVEADSPAAKAGLKAGDVVTKFDGKTIGSVEDFRRAVAEAAGEVAISAQREGRPVDLKATLRAADRMKIRPSGGPAI